MNAAAPISIPQTTLRYRVTFPRALVPDTSIAGINRSGICEQFWQHLDVAAKRLDLGLESAWMVMNLNRGGPDACEFCIQADAFENAITRAVREAAAATGLPIEKLSVEVDYFDFDDDPS